MRKLGFVLAALVLLVALVVSLGRATRPSEDATDQEPVPRADPVTALPAPDVSATTTPVATPTVALPALPATSDPDEYAVAVAAVVFGLDTRDAGPEDYRALLMAEADPQMSSRGRGDLERMVAERIPTAEQWQRMRANAQWSQWQTEDVWQPGAWDEVITSGQAEPGWAVRNVLGHQTVHFDDAGQERETARERTITIGMRCPAPGAQVDRCWLTLVGIGVVS